MLCRPRCRKAVLLEDKQNPMIAEVSETGLIKAKNKGKCKIWVYAQNGVYKTITVKVK